MTLFYTQILSPKKEIKISVFSKHGKHLNSDKKLLIDIKRCIQTLDNQKFYQYETGSYIIYIKIQHDILVVVADHSTSIKTVNVFMDHLTNDEFEIKKLMDKFNSENMDKEIQNEILRTKNICAQSLNQILNRGEKLKQLDEIANQLEMQVQRFQRESKKLIGDSVVAKYFSISVIVIIIFVIFYFFFR